MYYRLKIIILLQFIMLGSINGQVEIKASIKFYYDQPTQGVDNYFQVIAQQTKPITLNQLLAIQINFEVDTTNIKIKRLDNGFYVNPNDYGELLIEINSGAILEVKKFLIKRITAVSRLGKFKSNDEEKVSVGEFKAQFGIVALVECCGFDAKCKVIDYEIIRVSNNEKTKFIQNSGENFARETRKLIDEAVSGNIYIFRKIKAQCPGKENIQRLEDILIEIE